MINLIQNEFIKIKSKKIYKILFLLEIGFYIISLLYYKSFNLNIGFSNYIFNDSPIENIVNIVIIIISSESLGFEFSNKTIIQLFTKSKSKVHILLSKIFAIILIVILQYIFIVIINIILLLIFSRSNLSINNLKFILLMFLNQHFIGLLIAIFLPFLFVAATESTSFAAIITFVLCKTQCLSYSIFHSIRNYYLFYYANFPISLTGNSILFVSIITFLYLFVIFILTTCILTCKEIN